MTRSQMRFGLFFYTGLVLLVTSLSTFHFHAGAAGKILALRHFALALIGLASIVLAMVSHYFARRAGRLGDTQA